MSDSVPSSSGGAPGVPAPISFSPGSGPLPRGLRWDPLRPETVVCFLGAADDREWAADAAVALASGWAEAGRRIVLADLHLEDPVLHERLDEPNLDGVVDIFLYGASLARTARPVSQHSFYLISAGTYAPDPGGVLRDPRWAKIVSGFADAEATLCLFAPIGAPGVDALLRSVSAVIVLGDSASLPQGIAPRAMLVPPGAAGHSTRAAVLVAGVDDTALLGSDDDPLIGEYAEGIPASTLPAGARRPPREPELSEPLPPEASAKDTIPGRSWWSISPVFGVVLALAALFAAGFFLWTARAEIASRLGIPGMSDAAPAPAPNPSSAAPGPIPAASTPPTAVGVLLPYAVQVKAFASLPAARQFLSEQAAQDAQLPFYVTMEWIDRVPYYKVLAGFLADTLAASQLRERLVESGTVEEGDVQGSWSLIQHTPLAFDFGELPTRAAAEARRDSLISGNIPAYSIALPYTDGTERWRLYGGAFRDSTAAGGMRSLLSEAGVDAPLVPRIGRPSGDGG